MAVAIASPERRILKTIVIAGRYSCAHIFRVFAHRPMRMLTRADAAASVVPRWLRSSTERTDRCTRDFLMPPYFY